MQSRYLDPIGTVLASQFRNKRNAMSFKSPNDYKNFCHAIRHGNRYIHNEKVMSFLDELLETSGERQVILKKGHILWRAQLGNDRRVEHDEYGNEQQTDELCPYPRERMKPILYSATEGRANPKGIPYLYLATDQKAAMSEIKPWVGLSISVGQFKIKKDLCIIEFTEFSHEKFSSIKNKDLPRDEKRKFNVWSDIDNAFSEPVNSSDRQSYYVPTQIIAEFFKSKGFDGIAYKSSLSTGVNIVLFNIGMADLINCHLFEAKSVEFKYEQIANPYCVINGES